MRFEREWGALRAYAAERGIRLIGDVPIYVSDEGADLAGLAGALRCRRGRRGAARRTQRDRTALGQPALRLAAHRATGYRWWRERFRRTFELVDLCRIDHFRGFVSYWAIPARNTTAKNGRWRPGPGAELFHAVERKLGDLPVIAEDLGHITPPVYRLRDELGLPGHGRPPVGLPKRAATTRTAPENHRVNSVAYTSTHDTATAVGWFEALGRSQRAATGLDPREPNWGLIELAYSCRPLLAIVPAQDVLGLGDEARMNRPGVTDGNWRWQLERGALTPALARRLRRPRRAARPLAARSPRSRSRRPSRRRAQ